MFEFLKPVSKSIIDFVEGLHEHSLGKNTLFNDGVNEVDFSNGDVVLLSVPEVRNVVGDELSVPNFDEVRKELYQLMLGNWDLRLIDLGEIIPGNIVSDTYYAVSSIVSDLLNLGVLPIVLGGGNDLVYPLYRSFDDLKKGVNLVNMDSHFDIGNIELPISSKSYIGKVIMDPPYNLLNFTNIGYQSYYVSPEEKDLVQKLFFEAYRLGEITSNFKKVESLVRNADLISLDLNSVAGILQNGAPNGFSTREVCSLARYSGLSDQVSIFGIFEYDNKKTNFIAKSLVAQIIWYYIEGVSLRWNEKVNEDKSNLIHYNVPLNEEVYSFYKSKITGRWWMEIDYLTDENNILTKKTLLPCDYEDYANACNNLLTERWYNAKKRHEML